MSLKTPYLLFLGSESNPTYAKTGAGLAHWRPELCMGQLRLTPDTVDVGLPDHDITSAAAGGAKTLIIGTAVVGGAIPESWNDLLVDALESGLDIAAGAHTRLSSIDRLVVAAQKSGRQLIDVRVPPATIPVGTGLGSSSALETAVAVALNDAWQLSIDTLGLARVCQKAEKSVVGRISGLAEHIPTLVGEDDHAILFDSRSLDSDPIALGFIDNDIVIVVIDTGVSRERDLTSERFAEREAAVDALDVPSLRDMAPKKLPEFRQALSEALYRRAQHVINENQRVLDVARTLRNEGPASIGDIITASQASLRDDYDASGPELDLAIETALSNGALGARMIGLGQSGSAYALAYQSDV